MKTSPKYLALLALTALIWGGAFVAQSVGNDYLGPLAFNAARSLIGGAVLLPLITLLGRLSGNAGRRPVQGERKNLWAGGILCGLILAVASTLQPVSYTHLYQSALNTCRYRAASSSPCTLLRSR